MIAAARTMFARIGFAQTKLEDVADLAEFGKGTLYNYFPNKEALFASVLEDTFRGFLTIFEETLGGDEPFERKIGLCAERSLRYAFTNPEGIALMMRESHYLRENNPLMQLHPQLVRLLADTIAAEQQTNRSTLQHDPAQIAMLLMNMVMGQFINRLQLCFSTIACGPGGESGGDMAEQVFAAIREKNIDEDVAQATRLVCHIFFRGLYGEDQTP